MHQKAQLGGGNSPPKLSQPKNRFFFGQWVGEGQMKNKNIFKIIIFGCNDRKEWDNPVFSLFLDIKPLWIKVPNTHGRFGPTHTGLLVKLCLWMYLRMNDIIAAQTPLHINVIMAIHTPLHINGIMDV